MVRPLRLYVCRIDAGHNNHRLFFYLTFPAVKNILPVKDNEKILEFVEALHGASKYSAERKEPVLFSMDMDAGSCMIETEEPVEINEEAGYKPPQVQTHLRFTRARNSSKEVKSGKISFQFFPDGGREFGVISVVDPDTDEKYTIFINPYLSEPEIMKGDVDFNEMYPL